MASSASWPSLVWVARKSALMKPPILTVVPGARGEGGDLDRLLAGRHLCDRLLLGLHRAHFGHGLLGLADLGLLLLLRRQQQLDLAFQFGNACFQCLLFGGLCERHAR